MTELLKQHAVVCPMCWESNELTLELTAGTQSYIEDCAVCCNPMTIAVAIEDGELVSLDAEPG